MPKKIQKCVKVKINPKHIIPIHTQHKSRYADLFNANVIALNDGEIFEL